MAHLYDRFEIPDPHRSFTEEERGPFSSSAPLIPFTPPLIDADAVVGRVVHGCRPYVGTYGMGGPGFFGLDLGEEWLVVAMWGAGDWIHVNGRLVTDLRYAQFDRPKPWIHSGEDALSPLLAGKQIVRFAVAKHRLGIAFSGGVGLRIDPTPERRFRFVGNGEERAFAPDDDLRRSVFLSPTTEIWV